MALFELQIYKFNADNRKNVYSVFYIEISRKKRKKITAFARLF